MKRILLVLFIMLFAFSAAGCGGDKPEKEKADEIVYIVDLCYIDKEYAAAGNDDPLILRYYEKQHIFAKEGRQYLTLLDEILRGNVFGSDSITTMITDKIQFNSVVVKDGTAFVDLVGEGLAGSSFEEGLLISQIVNSLIGSFEEILRVQFLVDGEMAESLMGHYSADEPYEEGPVR